MKICICQYLPIICKIRGWSFSVLRRTKPSFKSTIGQDCLSHRAMLCIERAYVNRLDIEKVIDLNIVKKMNESILCLSKGILAFAINKTPKLKLFFVSIINRCLNFLQITFKSFFLVGP